MWHCAQPADFPSGSERWATRGWTSKSVRGKLPEEEPKLLSAKEGDRFGARFAASPVCEFSQPTARSNDPKVKGLSLAFWTKATHSIGPVRRQPRWTVTCIDRWVQHSPATGSNRKLGVLYRWMHRLSAITSLLLAVLLLVSSGMCIANCAQESAPRVHDCCPNHEQKSPTEHTGRCSPSDVISEAAAVKLEGPHDVSSSVLVDLRDQISLVSNALHSTVLPTFKDPPEDSLCRRFTILRV